MFHFVNQYFRSYRAFSSSGQVYYFDAAFLLHWLYRRNNFIFVSGRIDQQLDQSPFAFIQFIENLSHQWSVETCFHYRLGPVALNYRPDLFHEGNSVNITPCSNLMVPVVNFPLFFGQCSQERYSGRAFYSSPPW